MALTQKLPEAQDLISEPSPQLWGLDGFREDTWRKINALDEEWIKANVDLLLPLPDLD